MNTRDERIHELAARGVPHQRIADMVGCSSSTVRRVLRPETKTSRERKPLTDIQPAREHLLALLASRVFLADIAHLTGMSSESLSAIAHPERSPRRARHCVLAETSDAIRAITLDDMTWAAINLRRADVGTRSRPRVPRNRVHDLAGRGLTPAVIAARLGCTPGTVNAILRGAA